jgi:hypothetical protein
MSPLLLAVAVLAKPPTDWLVDKITAVAAVREGPAPVHQASRFKLLTLDNMLLTREFAIGIGDSVGAFGTWDISTAPHGSALRAFGPEAIVALDNTTYTIGGLVPVKADGKTACSAPSGVGPSGSCPVAYLNRTQLYAANRSAFQYVNHTVGTPQAPFPWRPGSRHTREDTQWPPAGVHLSVLFSAPEDADPKHAHVSITVHYELVDGLPILQKWVTVDATAAPKFQSTPPPAQSGPVHLAACSVSATNQMWVFPGMTTDSTSGGFGSPIFLKPPAAADSAQPAAAEAAEALCLSATNGSKFHSFNDKLDVLGCPENTADPRQLWTVDKEKSLIESTGVAGCCVDVNNHEAQVGQVCETSSCTGSWQWTLKPSGQQKIESVIPGGGQLFQPRASPSSSFFSSSSLEAQIESKESPGYCLAWTKDHPPTPPGPTPWPARSIIVTALVVETLRLNEPFAPTEARPFDPFYGQGSEFDDAGPTMKTRALSGFLYVHNSQRHGTFVRCFAPRLLDPPPAAPLTMTP